MAVALGGSPGRGRADLRSDVDLGVYYDPARPFSVVEFRAPVTELDDRHAPQVVGFGDWGPWINGGAWTRIHGVKADLLDRDLALVDRVLADCAEGSTCSYQPGHPHGFHSHAYAGYAHHNLPLHDPDGALAARKAVACLVQALFALSERWLLNEKGAVQEAGELPTPRPASPPTSTPP